MADPSNIMQLNISIFDTKESIYKKLSLISNNSHVLTLSPNYGTPNTRLAKQLVSVTVQFNQVKGEHDAEIQAPQVQPGIQG